MMVEDGRGQKLQKLLDWVERHPWMQDRFEIEIDALYPRIDEPKNGVTKMAVTKDEVPTETGKIAYDVLMAKAEQLRKVFPTLSIAQAFEKVYLDRANSDLALAERRGNGPYAKNCALADIEAVAKAALSTPAPGKARMEPEDLGHYETGPSMTPRASRGRRHSISSRRGL